MRIFSYSSFFYIKHTVVRQLERVGVIFNANERKRVNERDPSGSLRFQGEELKEKDHFKSRKSEE